MPQNGTLVQLAPSKTAGPTLGCPVPGLRSHVTSTGSFPSEGVVGSLLQDQKKYRTHSEKYSSSFVSERHPCVESGSYHEQWLYP